MPSSSAQETREWQQNKNKLKLKQLKYDPNQQQLQQIQKQQHHHQQLTWQLRCDTHSISIPIPFPFPSPVPVHITISEPVVAEITTMIVVQQFLYSCVYAQTFISCAQQQHQLQKLIANKMIDDNAAQTTTKQCLAAPHLATIKKSNLACALQL